MKWKEVETKSRKETDVDSVKELELDAAKASHLPEIQKEAEAGVKPFKPITFQPVRSPDRFEAEFGVKGDDLLFHFWPWNYHSAERRGENPPPFSPHICGLITRSLCDVFDATRVDVHEDRDVGAVFAKATGYGINQFHREMAIKACEALHKRLGGR